MKEHDEVPRLSVACAARTLAALAGIGPVAAPTAAAPISAAPVVIAAPVVTAAPSALPAFAGGYGLAADPGATEVHPAHPERHHPQESRSGARPSP